MRSSTSLVLALLLLAGGFGLWGWVRARRAEERLRGLEFTRERADFLAAENSRLSALLADRQRAESVADELRQRAAIEEKVGELGGRKFLRPVVFREIPRTELPAILSQKLSQQVPDKEFGTVALEFVVLGLIPPGMDLKKTYLALLGEQVGAFYDQHTHELFTFSEHPLTSSQNRVVMAHELTHALQDQQFDLLTLPLETKGNDDRALAASALVEGDATVVMNEYLVGDLSAAAVRDNLASALSTDVRQLAAAPRYLRETLLFPYLEGQKFVMAVSLRGGREAVARAFKDPPASSAQIMHPEKYLTEPREQPVTLTFADTTALGQPPAVDNVLGEFTVEQILELWTRDKMAAGGLAASWRGDRILVYGRAGACSYAWETVWRDAPAARAYCEATRLGLAARYGGKPPPPRPAGQNAVGDFAFTAGGRVVRAFQRGGKTLLVDAQDTRWADALAQTFSLDSAAGVAP